MTYKVFVDGQEGTTGLPKSNVLYFDLTNDSWCCARPSGTEPKIKFYMEAKATMNSREDIIAATATADAVIEQMKQAMGI